ncbi:unnamed protein product [Bemisia tabaci]|uniref:RRM domain-containing protein n=1 Tax=Bemisia tabaci TaxID=7038 RepID=A0A9P0C744_BEMTA|nr:unnamed protein product [Bemisia tabaci]
MSDNESNRSYGREDEEEKRIVREDSPPPRDKSRTPSSAYSKSKSPSPHINSSRRSYGRSMSRSRSRSISRSRSRSYGRDSRSHSRSPRHSRRRRRSPDRGYKRRYMGSRDRPKPNRCLGVFGLSIHTTEDQIYDIFSKYGSLERVQVIVDAQTRRSRGFCFVYFKNYEDAKAAKEECSDMDVDGRRIRVDFSITERAHTPTPGMYMGKPSYRSSGRRRGFNDGMFRLKVSQQLLIY